MTEDRIQHEYVLNYTDMSFLVKDEFAFKDGLYSGYNEEKRSYDRSSWDYAYGDDGFVRSDPTLKDPRCVYNLLKQHYARYTVEMVERICGTPADSIRQIWDMIASTAVKDKAMTILYALGWTQHSIGAQNVRAGTMVQLLLGNIGVAGGGMNALRGHSNIRGLTDIGLMSDLLPGYLTLPKQDEQDYDAYIAKRTQKPLRANQMSFWQNYPKFHVSLMKSWWGDAAADNNWCFDYLPKLDKPYDMLQAYELMNEGKIHGYICRASTPGLGAEQGQADQCVLQAEVHGQHGPAGNRDHRLLAEPRRTERRRPEHDPDRSVPPAHHFLRRGERRGGEFLALAAVALEGANPPGEARSDIEIMSELFHRIKALYEKDGGAWWEPVRDLAWNYANPEVPTPEELAMEYNGKALADVFDPKDPTGWCARPASSWPHSATCATTAAPPAAAGSTSVPGARPAT